MRQPGRLCKNGYHFHSITITFYAATCLILLNNIAYLGNNGLTDDFLPVNLFIISFVPNIFITLFIL